VIQEAFAAKIPVITTNLGGMAEAVTHEVNGLLFERGDASDLARQMKRVVDEPGLLERLRAGIPEVKSVRAEVEELEKIYFNLLANARGTEITG
jgi:glycosyltransferase involved in cell wall biosynthesis